MKKIYKFKLSTTDYQRLELPVGSEILTVQSQNDEPNIWAMVDPNQTTEFREFVIYGTGHPIEEPDSLTYIGTYQLNNGGLVFHLFEKF